MTLTATWIAGDPGSDQLWMASDSRISDAHGRLIDEGAKLYELPIVSRSPSAAGFFDEQTYGTTVGLLCAGSTLIFQQVYSTLVPTLGNLIGTNSIPTLEEVAQFIGRMTTLYTRSFGENRPRQARVSLVVGGRDPITGGARERRSVRRRNQRHDQPLRQPTEVRHFAASWTHTGVVAEGLA